MGACRSVRFGGGFRHSPGPGRGLVPAVLVFALALVAFHSLHAADERHTRFGEGLTFLYHEVDAALAEELWPLMVADRQEIMERLRLYPPGTLRVLLAPTREAFAAAHGGGAPPGALGLYYGATRTVLLRSPRTQPGNTWDLRGVMRHELAHGVLDLAIRRPIPRWLNEGMAILLADEMSFLDDSRLTLLAFRDRMIPLDLLMETFPATGHGLNVAYAQAASFGRYLLRRDGMTGIRRLLRYMAEGASTHAAFRLAYAEPLAMLEAKWHGELSSRFSWLATVTPLSVLGGLGGPLVLIAYLRRRLERRRRYREWEAEEQERLLLSGDRAPTPYRPGDHPRFLN